MINCNYHIRYGGKLPLNTNDPSTTSSFRNKVLCFLAALLLAILTIFAVFKGGGISVGELASSIRDASPPCLILSVSGMFGFIFFEGAALTVIVRSLGYPTKHQRGFVYSAADIYFSAITPSASGGQPASAFFMIRDGIPATAVMAALLLNLIMYTMAVITFGFFALILYPEIFLHFSPLCKVFILIGIITLTALALGFYLLMRKQQLLQKLALGMASLLDRLHCHRLARRIRHKLDDALEEYRQCVDLIFGKRKMLLQVYLLNLLQRLSQLLVTVFTFLAMHGNPARLIKLFATQIYVVLGSNSMPVPGAMGVADYLMINGYMELMTKEQAYRLEILSRGLSFYTCMILSMIVTGIGYLLLKKNTRGNNKT